MDATARDDERRWEEAGALLGNPQDEAILQGVRRRRRRMWWLFGAVMTGTLVVALLVGFLIAAGDEGAGDESSSGPLWLSIVGLTCTAVGLLIIVTYLIKGRRAGLFRLGPLSVLSHSQRRSLRRQMLGKEPLQPVHLPLLRYLADRMARQRNSALLLPIGLMLQQLGGFLSSPSRWRAGFVVALTLLFLAAGVQLQREWRRAERFLAEHPEQPEETAVSE